MIAEKPWRTESVLRLLFGFIMTFCFGAGLAGLLQSDKIKLSADQREIAGMAVAALFFYGGLFFWLGVFLRETPISWREAFGLETVRQAQAVKWGLIAGLLFLPLAWIMQELLASLITWITQEPATPQDLVQELQNNGLPWAEKAFMGVLAVFIAPPAEEMLFRGIVYPTIKQRGFPRAAWWVTSLVFALMHHNELSFVPLTLFSFVLIFLYEKTGSLWASMTAHSLFNFANFALLMFTSAFNPTPVK